MRKDGWSMEAKIEKAIQKCVDRINTSGDGENADIYKFMNRSKVLRDLNDVQYEAAYDEIASRLGFMEG